MLTRDQAFNKLQDMLSNQNLVKHCLAVEAAMAAYADHFQVSPEEKQQWQIAGLIHDADWEKFPEQHPKIIVKWLEESQAHPDVINAVASHGFELGVEPNCQMAHVIRACDELTGLITAVALVKGRDISAVTVESVKKKWKQKDFAAGVKREDIERGAAEINISLEDHIQIVLKAMQNIKSELGL